MSGENLIKQWRAEGWSLRGIAKALNEQGHKTPSGSAWSDNAVKRWLEAEAKKPAKPARVPVKLMLEDVDEDGDIVIDTSYYGPRDPGERFKPKDVRMSPEEYERFVQDARETTREMHEALKRDDTIPRNWLTGKKIGGTFWSDLFHDHLAMRARALYFRTLGLSSKEHWAEAVNALVAEQARYTGKDVHGLLDEVEGHAAAKGQLRRLWFSVLQQLAMWQETAWAQDLEIEALKEKVGEVDRDEMKRRAGIELKRIMAAKLDELAEAQREAEAKAKLLEQAAALGGPDAVAEVKRQARNEWLARLGFPPEPPGYWDRFASGRKPLEAPVDPGAA